ncbi:YitT family protein [Mordavella massiliensis]|uniref:YitT family protein n=1 Tax=Mordavella massiliensis TaxID=1871024 RepID=A0A938XAM6_9CLOT|nr:YitT family protein [Mordavella massiliensis]MBM6947360.1 YitT family protein [Mordavella massiliensis]
MKKSPVFTAFLLVLGCMCCSIATNWIMIPNGLAAPGITGISMTVEHFTGINYALIYYAITILILVVTYLTLGKRDASNIIILSLLYPMVLWVLSFIDVQIIFEEKLIALGAFGVLYGVGIGIPYRIGFSYGGDDTVAKILKKTILRATEFKKIYYFEEALILLFMTLAFSLDQLAYAFAGQLIYVNSMNYVVFNLGPKLYDVQMIGKDMEKIEDFVINTIHKSVTIYHDAVGGYSGEPKIQMSCVCNSREYVRLREFIRNGSFDCFIKVIPLVHVFGQNKDFHRLDDENIE